MNNMRGLKKNVSKSYKSKEICEDLVTESSSPFKPMEQNSQNKDKKYNQEKRKQKKKKKRKHSDPAVRDVTQLLSNSLSLLSPGNNIKRNDTSITVEENKSINNENNELSIKKNAFQFMMESRSKVIGLNSPGKDYEKEITLNDSEYKRKLLARRQVFSNWAEQKGSLKRKRIEEEEKNEIIHYKLKVREKRLKKLLKADTTMKSDQVIKKSKIKKLSSSEDNNSDFEKDVINIEESNSNSLTEIQTENKKLEEVCTEINKKTKKVEMQNNGTKKIATPVKQKIGNILDFVHYEKVVIKDSDVDSKSKKNKKKYKKSTKKNLKSEVTLDECSQKSDCANPRTLRSWKMKIKIDENNINSEMDANIKTEINYVEADSSDDDDDVDLINLSSSSEDEKIVHENPKKHVKIAPIFSKIVPKPKEDPALIEARKQFLMSGIPSSLKRTYEKQTSVAEQDYNVFRITYHVQQKSENSFWNLPQPELKLCEFLPFKVTASDLKCEKINNRIMRNLIIDTNVIKIDKPKDLLNRIKAENPNYPVYKSFRQILEKSGYKPRVAEEIKTTEKRRRNKKKKKNSKTESTCVQNNFEIDMNAYSMWTEKYKPRSSDDIIGNSEAIRNLKKWLDNWKTLSQELSAKKRIRSNGSESDFEAIDSDSRDSLRLPAKVIVLGGPCGSGKSSAVYAICNEMGFNIIELNASNKRTGKRLLQEIQEATQSHQVRQNDVQSFQNFFQLPSHNENSENEQQSDKKICVLLIEDVDIVFGQDDGFISALIQLASYSKRPIIVTTTNHNSILVQKFFNEYDYIPFVPLSSYILSVWLQIVLLCEGLYLSQDEIGSLLEYNRGDVRKTFLQLQFWVQSGGQIIKNLPTVKIEHKRECCEEQLDKDDPSEIYTNDTDVECEIVEHKNCIGSFEILEVEEPFKVPFYLNLGLLWWNIPNMVDIPNFSKHRTMKILQDNKENKATEITHNTKRKNKDKLLLLTKMYDSMTFTDISFKIAQYFDGIEPLVRESVKFEDSLEVGEVFEERYNDLEFVHELTHTLVNGCIKRCAQNSEKCRLNISLPDKNERRWRTKVQEHEKVYRDALSLSTENKSIALDYMPLLRSMTRSEFCRAATNTKRGNRFRNYLKELGVKCNDVTNKITCSILNND